MLTLKKPSLTAASNSNSNSTNANANTYNNSNSTNANSGGGALNASSALKQQSVLEAFFVQVPDELVISLSFSSAHIYALIHTYMCYVFFF